MFQQPDSAAQAQQSAHADTTPTTTSILRQQRSQTQIIQSGAQLLQQVGGCIVDLFLRDWALPSVKITADH